MSLRTWMSAALLLLALPFAACTTVPQPGHDPLDAGEWRTTKARMYQDLAVQCLAAGDHPRARRLLQEAVQFAPNDPESLRLLTRLCWASGDVDAADRSATLLLALQPESLEGLCSRGACAEARRRIDEAEGFFRTAAALAPHEPRPRIELHRLLLAAGRTDEAAALRRELAAAFPRSVEAELDHGAELCADGRWRDATEAYATAANARPDDGATATRLALSAVMAHEPATATALGTRLPPHVRGSQPSLALALAAAQLQLGDAAGALRELDQASRPAGDPPAVALLRGEILLRLGRAEAAQSAFLRAGSGLTGVDAARAFSGSGQALLALRSPHAAARAFEQALRLRPGHSPDQVLLACAFADAGERAAALQALRTLRNAPDAADMLVELQRRHPWLVAGPEAPR